jgi:uncharacterized repeat protein (TIGR03803 family)
LTNRLSSGLSLLISIVTVLVTGAVAQKETVLHSFGHGKDGRESGSAPGACLTIDGYGNLYGTTEMGGSHGYGTVFELQPKSGGGWTEKILHNFNNDADGGYPLGGLVLDSAGNLYGTTGGGGASMAGVVFELQPKASGGWTEKVLHNFSDNGKDGLEPYASLIFDAVGDLYGTTYAGGNVRGTADCFTGCGTVFELTPSLAGEKHWTEKILHNFSYVGGDGFNPYAGLVFDSAGNLYGTTYGGGIFRAGTVFELAPSGGDWTETVLHSFGHDKDGTAPIGGLILDPSGNLYGTTLGGGGYGCGGGGCGSVFELSPETGGGWTDKILYSFSSKSGGYFPEAGLVTDAFGNLYSTTTRGVAYGFNGGRVFELTPLAGGAWTETVLHSFGKGNDGKAPVSGLIFDASGDLYGTTAEGGGSRSCKYGCGTVFKIMPQTPLTLSPSSRRRVVPVP